MKRVQVNKQEILKLRTHLACHQFNILEQKLDQLEEQELMHFFQSLSLVEKDVLYQRTCLLQQRFNSFHDFIHSID